jgi:hypothetical protein
MTTTTDLPELPDEFWAEYEEWLTLQTVAALFLGQLDPLPDEVMAGLMIEGSA